MSRHTPAFGTFMEFNCKFGAADPSPGMAGIPERKIQRAEIPGKATFLGFRNT
jgi:hypothetical protein